MTEVELAWLAGWLEGEGSFLKGSPSCPGRARITAMTTDYDVALRVSALFGTNPYKTAPPKKAHWKQTYVVAVNGRRAVELMGRLRPLMGARRRHQLDAAVASFVPRLVVTHELQERVLALWRVGEMTQSAIGNACGLCRETVNKIISREKKRVMVAVV